MKDFLSPDSLIGGFLTTIFNLMLLNILWLFSSIFVVTIGASTIALYTVTFKMTDKSKIQQGVVKTYFKAFRDNFRQSIPVTIMFYVIVGMLFVNFNFSGMLSDSIRLVVYGASVALLILAVVIFEYMFPIIAIFNNSFMGYLLASIQLSFKNIFLTIIVFLVNIFIPVLVIVVPEVIAFIIPFTFFVGGSLVAYVVSRLMCGMMEKLKENSTN